ncbi:prolyl-tRNA synthetase associated domain-containing protein [Patescibacteria group bacterium]|nr:prolyl-tRNA synthetase associated domain-containing protein [Patescibacteria group bacterium]MBU2259747.1 prolyl-tRNA synthetase associated domain-containing protein [Patescibacteria group bacterium]
MSNIESFLTSNGIAFERFEHPAVFTCEQAEELTPDMPGAHTKNLFLRDKKGKRNIFVAVGFDKNVDLKALKDVLNADKLSFASPERLKKYLGVDPGAVSLLGLINDIDCSVEVIIDESVWKADAIQTHPLVNTATLVISHEGIEKFLEVTGYEPKIVDVPER